MTYLYSANLWLHIVFAAIALVLFWVPIFTKKGHLNHRKFGHHYKVAMYTVALTGVLMATMMMAQPFVVKPEYLNHENPEAVVAYFRSLNIFLIFLALLTFTTTRHGIEVLAVKDKREQLRKFNYIVPVWMLAVGGVMLFVFGIVNSNVLHIAFGILGLVIGVNMLRYCLKTSVAKRQWIIEHIGSMIGSGIAAYTAFLTFGGRTLFSDLGQWQLVFWVAPGIVGGIASYIVCKRYAQMFGVVNEQAEV
ncbi:hypothetical protein [Glaciecola sp. SC05]|uniref:hypothetical protein n=1 Tax=Glaciecola sp. SC05 TaxID=1987355 RepID=UPI003529BC71